MFVILAEQPASVLGFTVARGKIVEIDAILDPERLRPLDLAVLGEA
jgi:RNA polymerase sigma-70 factor (ECF subfamily)